MSRDSLSLINRCPPLSSGDTLFKIALTHYSILSLQLNCESLEVVAAGYGFVHPSPDPAEWLGRGE